MASERVFCVLGGSDRRIALHFYSGARVMLLACTHNEVAYRLVGQNLEVNEDSIFCMGSVIARMLTNEIALLDHVEVRGLFPVQEDVEDSFRKSA